LTPSPAEENSAPSGMRFPCRSRGNRPAVTACDLALRWDALVAQNGILQSGISLHFEHFRAIGAGRSVKGQYSVPISGI
jgi:hypothetical protein